MGEDAAKVINCSLSGVSVMHTFAAHASWAAMLVRWLFSRSVRQHIDSDCPILIVSVKALQMHPHSMSDQFTSNVRLADVRHVVQVPEGVDWAAVVKNAMDTFNVEIAGGLGE